MPPLPPLRALWVVVGYLYGIVGFEVGWLACFENKKSPAPRRSEGRGDAPD